MSGTVQWWEYTKISRGAFFLLDWF